MVNYSLTFTCCSCSRSSCCNEVNVRTPVHIVHLITITKIVQNTVVIPGSLIFILRVSMQIRPIFTFQPQDKKVSEFFNTLGSV